MVNDSSMQQEQSILSGLEESFRLGVLEQNSEEIFTKKSKKEIRKMIDLYSFKLIFVRE